MRGKWRGPCTAVTLFTYALLSAVSVWAHSSSEDKLERCMNRLSANEERTAKYITQAHALERNLGAETPAGTPGVKDLQNLLLAPRGPQAARVPLHTAAVLELEEYLEMAEESIGEPRFQDDAATPTEARSFMAVKHAVTTCAVVARELMRQNRVHVHVQPKRL